MEQKHFREMKDEEKHKYCPLCGTFASSILYDCSGAGECQDCGNIKKSDYIEPNIRVFYSEGVEHYEFK